MNPLAADAVDAALAGIGAADPTTLVKQAAREGRAPAGPLQVLALGKAAPRMVWGLVEAGVEVGGLGVTVPGAQAPGMEGFTWLVGDHPVPGPSSFAAGEVVLEWAERLDPDRPVLVLLSGGASACVEAPATGWKPADVARLHADMVRGGRPITEMNAARTTASRIKGGHLGRRLLEAAADVRCWVLADAPDPRVVGSGPCDAPGIEHHVLADNDTVVAAAGLRLASKGYAVFRHPGRVDGPVADEVAAFLRSLQGLEGRPAALVGGGEPLVAPPPDAPPGGRTQHSALTAAAWLAAHDSPAVFTAIATDGVDGSTREAGAWITADDADDAALGAFDAHRHLHARDRTIRLGPTGTNVNDLWIGLMG